MASTVMMYVLPMLLGQTYDLGKDKPGLLIYPRNISDEALVIQRYLTDSQYRMVENADQIKDFLDVSGKLSLKIKSGLLDVSGEGRYLKENSANSNGLDILVKLHFETVTLTIPSSMKPLADLSTMSQDYMGTHYCRSITYGGDLVASIRISGSGRRDLEKIKGALSAGLKTQGASFEGDIKGKLEMLKKANIESSSMEIRYYASVPIHGVSHSIDGLLKLVNDFPDHVKKVNKGLGNPLKMELYPLNYLSSSVSQFFENRALLDELDDLNSQFDDIQSTRKLLANWIDKLPPNFPEVAQKLIKDFSDQVISLYSTYMDTISKLDTTKGASTDHVTQAFDAYKGNGSMLPQKYGRKFRQLQAKIFKDFPELVPKNGGGHYIHWGRSECSSSGIKTSVSGVTVSSALRANGGSSDYLCLPNKPDLVDPEEFFKGNLVEEEYPKHLFLSPLKFKGSMKRFKALVGKNIACAHCRADSRHTVLVKMASKSCPSGWTKEYDGYLMGPSMDSEKPGEFICVDNDAKEPLHVAEFGDASSKFQAISETTVRCGALPCKETAAMKPIHCVVCTV